MVGFKLGVVSSGESFDVLEIICIDPGGTLGVTSHQKRGGRCINQVKSV